MTDIAVITTSRSATETRQKCRKERFLAFHKDGTGIALNNSKYDAEFGIIVHEAMKEVMLAARSGGVEAVKKVPMASHVERLALTLFFQFPDLE